MHLPKIFRLRSSQLSANQYFLVCLVGGFLISFYWPPADYIQPECSTSLPESIRDNENFEPQLNLAQKPMIAKKSVKSIIRPRYFSSELNVKQDRLFIAVLTDQENIDNLATAFNKTTAHLVNKIKFFIHADNVKTNFKLKNIVGFTDTRENYRPFHVLKYIADNYLEDYDFFYVIEDAAYVNAKFLMERVNHISTSFDVYMGTKLEDRVEGFCDLRAGILFSGELIRKIKGKLDMCVRNADGTHHSINIGRCVQLASNIKECQESFQGISLKSYELTGQKIYRDLHLLKDDPNFNSASSIYPIKLGDDLFILHIYFSKLHLEAVKEKITRLEEEAQNIGNGKISNNVLEVKWPLGVPNSMKPHHRYDILLWTSMNLTHSFMGADGTNVKPLNNIDATDIRKVLDGILLDAKKKYPELTYFDLESAYRRFDHVRGMEYKLHINFKDENGDTVTKSYEAIKPISLIQIIPSPYVTESTRISMIVPTYAHRIDESIKFIAKYEDICIKSKDSTTLMLVLLYNSNHTNKGESDVFYRLKNVAVEASKRIKNDDSRIAWVSIRLPPEYDYSYRESDELLNSIYGNQEILSLAITDLALKKLGLDTLNLIFSNQVNFKTDFLNRVRMNTIQGFQIFSPVGFMLYPCRKTSLCNACESCDVAQSTGYFDQKNYDIISFYSRDYVDGKCTCDIFVNVAN